MKQSNKKHYIISAFLIIIGLILIIYEIYFKYNDKLTEEKNIEKFLETVQTNSEIEMQSTEINNQITNNYIAVLEIPKINLIKGLYSITDYNNNVDRNIEILKDSDMPNIENGNFILAGHSGMGRAAYFNNLYKLNVGDTINIYYNNTKYIYKVVKIYEVEKTGKVLIERNKLKTTLTMITCHYSTNKQIVFISELIDKIN